MSQDESAVRDVLVHYHLFKNAGSSVDRMLKSSFGKGFVQYDDPNPGKRISARELQQFLEASPEIEAFSSHQLVAPVARGDFRVTPVVLLRHPVARARSAWLFEWKTQKQTDTPAGSFAEYVREKLGRGGAGVIADFQVSRLGNTRYDSASRPVASRGVDRLDSACRWIDGLGFFGLVECFAETLELMKATVGPRFDRLAIAEYHENATQATPLSLAERIDRIRDEIGDELYVELCRRNENDLWLYSHAVRRFDERLRRAGLAELAVATEKCLDPDDRSLAIAGAESRHLPARLRSTVDEWGPTGTPMWKYIAAVCDLADLADRRILVVGDQTDMVEAILDGRCRVRSYIGLDESSERVAFVEGLDSERVRLVDFDPQRLDAGAQWLLPGCDLVVVTLDAASMTPCFVKSFTQGIRSVCAQGARLVMSIPESGLEDFRSILSERGWRVDEVRDPRRSFDLHVICTAVPEP